MAILKYQNGYSVYNVRSSAASVGLSRTNMIQGASVLTVSTFVYAHAYTITGMRLGFERTHIKVLINALFQN